MARLCERPGCSEPASVAYGMRPEDLVFWLDVLRDDAGDDVGVLCRRHADSMVVPRGWTLDDLRDPDLHLFRPPDRAPVAITRRRTVTPAADVEQLVLGGVDGDGRTERADTAEREVVAPAAAVHAEADDSSAPAAADDGDATESWTPAFDDGDDLDGLLAARSPLLARAFRGTDRPAT